MSAQENARKEMIQLQPARRLLCGDHTRAQKYDLVFSQVMGSALLM